MTQLEDLLRQTLAETPAAPTVTDPWAGVERRVRRARRRVGVAAAGAVAAVTAAIVVPLAALGGSAGPAPVGPAGSGTPTHRPGTVQGPPPATWVGPGHAIAVATGDDGSTGAGVWALVRGGKPDSVNVVHFNADGLGDQPIAVPGPVDYLSVGLGYVWAYGGGDGGFGNLSVIDRIDPASGAVTTLRIHGKGAPTSMAFTAQGAYVSLAVRDEVVRVSGVGGPLGLWQSVPVPHQPTRMAVTDDGSLWVWQSLAHSWAHLDVADGRSRLLGTVKWSGPLLAFSRGGAIWTTDVPRRLVEITPSELPHAVSAAYGDRIPALGLVTDVVDAANGGIYLATTDPQRADAPGKAGGISYYSPAAQDAGSAPTYRLAGVSVQRIAATSNEGVVFVTGDGAMKYWNPRGPSIHAEPPK